MVNPDRIYSSLESLGFKQSSTNESSYNKINGKRNNIIIREEDNKLKFGKWSSGVMKRTGIHDDEKEEENLGTSCTDTDKNNTSSHSANTKPLEWIAETEFGQKFLTWLEDQIGVTSSSEQSEVQSNASLVALTEEEYEIWQRILNDSGIFDKLRSDGEFLEEYEQVEHKDDVLDDDITYILHEIQLLKEKANLFHAKQLHQRNILEYLEKEHANLKMNQQEIQQKTNTFSDELKLISLQIESSIQSLVDEVSKLISDSRKTGDFIQNENTLKNLLNAAENTLSLLDDKPKQISSFSSSIPTHLQEELTRLNEIVPKSSKQEIESRLQSSYLNTKLKFLEEEMRIAHEYPKDTTLLNQLLNENEELIRDLKQTKISGKLQEINDLISSICKLQIETPLEEEKVQRRELEFEQIKGAIEKQELVLTDLLKLVQSIDSIIERESVRVKKIHVLLSSVMDELYTLKRQCVSHEKFLSLIEKKTTFTHSSDIYDARDELLETIRSFAEESNQAIVLSEKSSAAKKTVALSSVEKMLDSLKEKASIQQEKLDRIELIESSLHELLNEQLSRLPKIFNSLS